MKTFLLERATKNELVALRLYWYVKVEIKDAKPLNSGTVSKPQSATPSSSSSSLSFFSKSKPTGSNLAIIENQSAEIKTVEGNSNFDSDADKKNQEGDEKIKGSSSSNSLNNFAKTNFQVFMDELLDKLQNVHFVQFVFIKKL